MRETFGEFIKKMRVKESMRLTQLGAKLGIDSGALSKIENGKRKYYRKLLKHSNLI